MQNLKVKNFDVSFYKINTNPVKNKQTKKKNDGYCLEN